MPPSRCTRSTIARRLARQTLCPPEAYEASTGDWLLFTDADVRFKPDVLRRAITLAKAANLEHLTLLGDVEMVGFWETVLITFFGMPFTLPPTPIARRIPFARLHWSWRVPTPPARRV